MSVLSGIEPTAVFRYFEEICSIPHGSSNTKQISDYCVKFAKEHKLRYIQDSYNNVIIFKEGTSGYENSQPVMIQGHLDMVCEKDKDCKIDFLKKGLELQVKDGMVFAKGTTLGGDDGIAVAYSLAILESKEIPHPPLEIVFTVDEEIGMLGAAAIDCSKLKSKTMLNLDSEEEGYLLVSCAGGITSTCHIPIEFTVEKSNDIVKENAMGEIVTITVTGLSGGHSGVEIDKGRGNANQILGRILYALQEDMKFGLIELNGGLKDNAIPREAYAKLLIADKDIDKVKEIVTLYNKILKSEYSITDSDVSVILKETALESLLAQETDEQEYVYEGFKMMSFECAARVITALVMLPNGIQKMSHAIDGLVQTSLNLGILETGENEVTMSFSVRSSVGTEKEELIAKLRCLMVTLGGHLSCSGDYPAWEYKEESKLRDLMEKVYEEQTGQKPVIQALHAGVECGLFAGKIRNLDCVSFGPDIKDIHTPFESMSIESVGRTWNYLKEILKNLK